MEQKIVERRTVLKGGAAAIGMLGSGASASMVAGVEQASADTTLSSVPDQILTAIQRFRETIPANFDQEYVEKVVRPFFLTSFYEGERPMLPMIDVTFSKENALPYDLWGLITRDWRPTPEDGVTVFLQGLEKRGPNNLRKRIYFSGVTPDLYKPMYSAKVVAFFDKLMDQKFSALSRQTAGASRLSRMPGQAPMAHLRSKGLAFLWSAIATSAHPTQVPSRSGLRDAHLRPQTSRSTMDARQTSPIAVLERFSVLLMGRAFRFATMPA